MWTLHNPKMKFPLIYIVKPKYEFSDLSKIVEIYWSSHRVLAIVGILMCQLYFGLF